MIAGNGGRCSAIGGAVGTVVVTVANNCITGINYRSTSTQHMLKDTHV
jgi:hypothetical protein